MADAGTTDTCEVALLTVASKVAGPLIGTGTVSGLHGAEGGDAANVSVTCGLTAPVVSTRSTPGPQNTTAELIVPRQPVSVVQGSSSATVVVTSEIDMVMAPMTTDTQGRPIRQPVVHGGHEMRAWWKASFKSWRVWSPFGLLSKFLK